MIPSLPRVSYLLSQPPQICKPSLTALKKDCDDFINLPPSVQLLVAKITINAQNWAEYVNVPGQKLELQKCECIPLVWVPDDNGFFTISKLPENAVQIKEPDTGET